MTPRVFSATRLTAYALLSALEADLRAIAVEFLQDLDIPERVLGTELFALTRQRLTADYGQVDAPALKELLEYSDLGAVIGLLNRYRATLPPAAASVFAQSTTDLARLAPIRNRVMHARPLHFDDLAVTIDVVEKLRDQDKVLFKSVVHEYEQISRDPSVVLRQTIPPAPDERTTVAHNLPIPDFDETGFVGRKEVAHQLAQLCRGPYPVITIVGEGGLGKTALALKVAYDLLDADPCPFDAIVWTSSKTSMLTAQEVVRIDGAIKDSLGMFTDIASQLAGDVIDIKEPIEEILSYLQTFRILLVLDNLETVLDDRIKNFIGRLPHGSKVLVTSRIGLGAYEYPVKLDKMAEGDAVQLLRALAKVRGVQRLVRMPNPEVARLCERMTYNPGWIKWFVAAAQSGKRPEDILANPRVFLNFCMSNVYEYLTPDSKTVLEVMIGTSASHSQADLAYLADMDPSALQRALQQLLSTNMVTMVSIPSGLTYQSMYEISELARAYLKAHHPIDTKKLQELNRRRQHLILVEQRMMGSNRHHPYDQHNIHMRSRGDIVPAKYLKDALEAARRRKFGEAEKLVENAQRLAPDYYEVYRVQGNIKSMQGHHSLAQTAFEKAVELQPSSAPLRLFFGECLLQIGDPKSALEQFRQAEQLDPEDYLIQLEKARSHLFLHEFREARDVLDKLAARTELTLRAKVKVTDTYIQYFIRKAEAAIDGEDVLEACSALMDLKESYLRAPKELVDEKTRSRLWRAANVAMACVKREKDTVSRRKMVELFLWFQANAGVPASVVTHVDRARGDVRIATPKREIAMRREDFVNDQDWERVKVGSYVYYCVTAGDGTSGATAGVLLV